MVPAQNSKSRFAKHVKNGSDKTSNRKNYLHSQNLKKKSFAKFPLQKTFTKNFTLSEKTLPYKNNVKIPHLLALNQYLCGSIPLYFPFRLPNATKIGQIKLFISKCHTKQIFFLNFHFETLWRNYHSLKCMPNKKLTLLHCLRRAYIERNQEEWNRKIRKRITILQHIKNRRARKHERLWRHDTKLLRLKKAKRMHANLNQCTFHGSALFLENVKNIITHFLGAAYSYQILFWGHKYVLRVCGHE